MRVGAALQDIRTLTTPAIARRAAVVAALGFSHRILTLATARVLFETSFLTKFVVGASLSVMFTAHTLIQRAFSAQTEAELMQRAAAAALDGDVFRARLTSLEETRVELVQGVYQTSLLMSQALPNLAADMVSSVVLGAWVAFVEPARLSVAAGGMAIAAAAALLFSQRSVERAVARSWPQQSAAFAMFVDLLDGRLEVLASGLRGAFLSDFRRLTKESGKAAAAVAGSAALAGRLPLLGIAILVAVVLAVSPWARHSAGASLSDVALFASVTPAFAGIAQGVHGLARAERWMGVVVTVLRSALPAATGTRAVDDEGTQTITFEQVSFSYDPKSGEDALHGIGFAWQGPGVLALAGPNGSGKSTCLRLLLAMAKPTAGRILIGGEVLEKIDIDAWRQRVAFMPQRPYLPWRSDVRQAVSWLAPGSSDERIVRALDRVGLSTSVRRGGSDPLTVKVDTLSVGERQRVALARMLCRDAGLFVLDEPDANLDRAGIAMVAGVLRDLGRRCTVIVAAHTPELVSVADRLISLEGGRVVDDPAWTTRVDRRTARP
jgi:ABC-type multidrug transport system fused ATPase/permease subunit